MTQNKLALCGGIAMSFIWELVGFFSYSHCVSRPLMSGWCDVEFKLWTLFALVNLVIYASLLFSYKRTESKFILCLIFIFFIVWLYFIGNAIFQLVRYL